MGKKSREKGVRRELLNDEQSFLARLTYFENGLLDCSRVSKKLLKYTGPLNPLILSGIKQIIESLEGILASWKEFLSSRSTT